MFIILQVDPRTKKRRKQPCKRKETTTEPVNIQEVVPQQPSPSVNIQEVTSPPSVNIQEISSPPSVNSSNIENECVVHFENETVQQPQCSKTLDSADSDDYNKSTSARKLSYLLEEDDNVLEGSGSDSDGDTYSSGDPVPPSYLLIDTEVLLSFLTETVLCGICSKCVTVHHDLNLKQGLAHFISLSCYLL